MTKKYTYETLKHFHDIFNLFKYIYMERGRARERLDQFLYIAFLDKQKGYRESLQINELYIPIIQQTYQMAC